MAKRKYPDWAGPITWSALTPRQRWYFTNHFARLYRRGATTMADEISRVMTSFNDWVKLVVEVCRDLHLDNSDPLR